MPPHQPQDKLRLKGLSRITLALVLRDFLVVCGGGKVGLRNYWRFGLRTEVIPPMLRGRGYGWEVLIPMGLVSSVLFCLGVRGGVAFLALVLPFVFFFSWNVECGNRNGNARCLVRVDQNSKTTRIMEGVLPTVDPDYAI